MHIQILRETSISKAYGTEIRHDMKFEIGKIKLVISLSLYSFYVKVMLFKTSWGRVLKYLKKHFR